MKKKMIQDFTHKCCQMFLNSTSNMDLVNIVIFGSGTIEIDFLSRKCIYNNVSISPLHYCIRYSEWLEQQCNKNNIDLSNMTKVTLQITVNVETSRRTDSLGWLTATYDFSCFSCIETKEQAYSSQMSEIINMGLGQILYDRVY